MGQLDGKVALVTGAASGIGAKTALTLAREGAKVVATDIDEAGGAEVVDEIRSAGGEAIFLKQDVREEPLWVEVVARTEARFGRLDILVSNAGIGLGGSSIVDMPLEDWRRQTSINLDGVFLSCKHALPLMRKGGRGGSIVLLSSVAGLRGAPTLVGYCATKGGVRLFAKALALECAAKRDGVRVNSVHPGIIDTPIWGKIGLPPASQDPGRNAPPTGEERGKATPLGYAGDPQNIADGILFLASDASCYMTGSELVIDGGMTAGVSRGTA
ncbi:MAG: glucose 1-dehydrogenase [Pseudomonadota bacterium]|nr:glucose 1-dehydrogenase [Pseudomonadota bacterium]MEE3100878.1 glucose 1-dehydrogenase [Pseudomonadota bacterium]